MDHNNRAFVKDLLVWFNNKHEKNYKRYKDIIIISSGSVSLSESISIPGTMIISDGYIEYHARWDLELKVILVKHGY